MENAPNALCTIAIATYGERGAGFVPPAPHPGVQYLIVWQMPSAETPASWRRPDISVWSMQEKGLSKARNVALQHVTTPVMLLGDDDVEWELGAVVEAASALLATNADIGVADFLQGPAKVVMDAREPGWSPSEAIGRVSSCEVLLRVEAVRAHGEGFNHSFGAGSGMYPSGEENLFVKGCVDARATVVYLPIVLGWHPEMSTGYRHIDARGAEGRLRVAATLRPFPPAWLRRWRFVVSVQGWSIGERWKMLWTPTPPVPRTRLEDMMATIEAVKVQG